MRYKTMPNLGHYPRAFYSTNGEHFKTVDDVQKMSILSNSIIFGHNGFYHCPLPLAVIVYGLWPPLNFGDCKYASNYGKVAYYRLGNVQRSALVAILLDNCCWSSFVSVDHLLVKDVKLLYKTTSCKLIFQWILVLNSAL